MYSFKVLLQDGVTNSSKDQPCGSGKVMSGSIKQSSSSNGRTAAVSSNSASAASKQVPSAAVASTAAPGRSSDGKPVCYNCGAKGHTGDRCKQPYCDRCEKFRHVAGECSRACRKCGALDHRIDGGLPCKNYQCKECGLFGHIYAECPNIICNLCNEYGHLARECPGRGKATGSSIDSGSMVAAAGSPPTAQPAVTAPPQQQQQQPQPQQETIPAAPKQQQQRSQQAAVISSAEEGQQRARVMDILMSRLEEYALALFGDEEKLSMVCRVSEDELRAILGRPNAQHNLDAAAARIQQQLQKQQQQQQQQEAVIAPVISGTSGTAGAVTAVKAVAGGGSVTRVASLNGPTAAAGATAGSSSGVSNASPAAAAAGGSSGLFKSDAASRAHVCGRCGERGHNKDNCTMPKCSDCGRFRHSAGQCSKACRDCGGLDHKSGPGHPMCVNYKCRECGLYGHVYAECPNIRCNMCGDIGHKALECPTIVCNICKQKGHKARDCTACGRCGQQGHRTKDCTGPRADVRCVHCGEWGHMASTCPGPVAASNSAAATASSSPAATTAAPGTAAARTENSRAAAPAAAAGSTGAAAPAVAAVAARPAVVAAGGAGAWAAAAAGRRLVTPTTVKLLPASAAAASVEAGERRQRLLDLLMVKLDGYAASLVAAEDELTALCRIADEDIRALLETSSPEQQLDAAIRHVQAVQQQEAAAVAAGAIAAAAPAPLSAAQSPQRQQQQQQQQHKPGQGSWARPLQLQQPQAPQQPSADPEASPRGSYGRSAAGGDTVKPAELLPQYAAALTAEFPGYFPDDWQQYGSWRSLEDQMSFPDPQNRSRAQYRQRRQHFQALTAHAMAAGGTAPQTTAHQAAAAEAEDEEEQEHQQGEAGGHVIYTAVGAADGSPVQPGTPPAEAEPALAAPAEAAGPLSWVRLLPCNSVDEETLGSRFNHVLDMMLPQFESFVQSLNEDKWRLLAHIEEADLAALLAQPEAEQQLDLLLSSTLQTGQCYPEPVSQHHEQQQQAQAAAPRADDSAVEQLQQHQHQQLSPQPLQPQQEPPVTAPMGQAAAAQGLQQQQQQQQHSLAHSVQHQQQQPMYSHYAPTAPGSGLGLQQQFGQYPERNPYMIPHPAAAGLGLNDLGLGMSLGLNLAGYGPSHGAAGGVSRPGGLVGGDVHPGSCAGYQQDLQQPGVLQQLQQQHAGAVGGMGLHQMHMGLQQQVPAAVGVPLQQQQAGVYGAPYYRRSSTGTAGGDEVREQDLERMIGFLGM